MLTLSDMTLDDAKELFDNTPSQAIAGAYLETAAQYARDEMIGASEALSIMVRVGEWLRDGEDRF